MLTRGPAASSRARNGTSAARSNGCRRHRRDRRRPGPPRPPRSPAAPSPPPPASRTCWNGCPSVGGEHRAQHLMPPGHISQRRRQRRRRPGPRPAAAPPGCCTSPLGPSSCHKNHSRCCANDNGTRPGRGRAASAARRRPGPGQPRRQPGRRRRLEHRPHRQLRAQHRPDPADQPHRQQRMPAQVKETVLGPDPLQAQHLGERPAQDLLRAPWPAPGPPTRRRSRGRAAPPGPPSRSASAAASSTTTAAGTMYSGSRPAANPRTAAASSRRRPSPSRRRCRPIARGDHVADQPLVTGGVLADASPRPGPPPGSAASTASTSPGSTRNPRIFTWSSARPANSSTPPRVHRARSPVRYIRSPPPPNGHATNRSAVSPARPRYPRARPAPATYSSPATPAGTGPSHPSSTNTRVFATGVPIAGTCARAPAGRSSSRTPSSPSARTH